jgi:hypothetical protein
MSDGNSVSFIMWQRKRIIRVFFSVQFLDTLASAQVYRRDKKSIESIRTCEIRGNSL